jgi:hypothetical protein
MFENVSEVPKGTPSSTTLFDQEWFGPQESSGNRSSQPEPTELTFTNPYGDASPKILAVAEDSLEQMVWKDSAFAEVADGGRWGAAQSVSEILQKSGFSCADNASVTALVNELKASTAWKPAGGIDEAKAGDIIYGSEGSRTNIGIVGKDENGKPIVYMSNAIQKDGETGKWSKVPLAGFVNDFAPADIHILRAVT